MDFAVSSATVGDFAKILRGDSIRLVKIDNFHSSNGSLCDHCDVSPFFSPQG